jgi:hypothetical protein
MKLEMNACRTRLRFAIQCFDSTTWLAIQSFWHEFVERAVLVHTLGICCLELGDTKYGLLMVKAVR